MVPKRLRRLEELPCPGGQRVFVARSFRARLLGLALLPEVAQECALLIPRCSCVHTFGMRFALDLTFLDSSGRTLQTTENVGPWRVVRRRGAGAVLERAATPTPRAC